MFTTVNGTSLHPYFAGKYDEAIAKFNASVNDPEDTLLCALGQREVWLIEAALILLGATEPTAYGFTEQIRARFRELAAQQKGGE